jgi:dipeptidyl-peptidase 4
MKRFTFSFAVALIAFIPTAALSQSRLRNFAEYEDYAIAKGLAAKLMDFAPHDGRWLDANRFSYAKRGKWYVYDRRANVAKAVAPVPPAQETTLELPERGRQFTTASSSDGKRAQYIDGNIEITLPNGESFRATTEGDLSKRVKCGSANWVYGEELEQHDAMGFSPDGERLWYFRFDESGLRENLLLLNLVSDKPRVYTETYPRPGDPNPVVDLYVFDVPTRRKTRVEVRSGAFNDGVGHYAFAPIWRPDGKALLFHRMDRRQQILELCSADPATGEVRVLDRQRNSSGWVEYIPLHTYSPFTFSLGPTKLVSLFEDSGFYNIGMVDLNHGKRRMISNHKVDVLKILRVDPQAGEIDYVTDNPSKPYHQMVWRTSIDGTGAKKLTDSIAHHTVWISPDGKTIIDRSETPSRPPELQVLDTNGRRLKSLEASNQSNMVSAGFTPTEWIHTKANDRSTEIYGRMSKPRHFNPKKKYPVLLRVYGGPIPQTWWTPAAEYRLPDELANLGFIVLEALPRGGASRGRAFRQVLYRNFGGPEIDDMASLATYMSRLPYVDSRRIGIEGGSYGGYASTMAILRYPNTFAAACASVSGGDWRYYDSIYTERYLGLPTDKGSVYDKASCLNKVNRLRGSLMIAFGTADDNGFLSNTMALIDAFQKAGKSIDTQIMPDVGHAMFDEERMMEFFIERMSRKS